MSKDITDVQSVDDLKTVDDYLTEKAPQIQFGEDFEDWDSDKKIRYLKRLASTMNHAADMMQNERNELLAKVKVLKAQLASSEQNLTITKDIMRNALTSNNTSKDEFATRIHELEYITKTQDKVIEELNMRLKSKSK